MMIEKPKYVRFRMADYPAVWMLVFMAIGIITGILIGNWQFILNTAFITLPIIVLLMIRKVLMPGYVILIILSGMLLSLRISSVAIPKPDGMIPEMKATLSGTVERVLNKKDKYARLLIRGSIDTKSLNKIDENGILLSVYGNQVPYMDLYPCMEVYANVLARLPQEKSLPTDFPENIYARSLDVQWLARAKDDDFAIINESHGYLYYIEKWSRDVKTRINLLFPSSTSGIVSALVTGDKSQISQEDRNIFSYSGTAHVVAVSGLHVGIIAAFIYLLLGFIPNRTLKLIIFLICLIFYISMTGFQPSAMRAGFMASLVYLAGMLQRHHKIINILCLSVLILIIIQPELIFSGGFQMSVASILGIGIFYQQIRYRLGKLNMNNNRVTASIIDSNSVTLAASIVVTPIVAYYFNIYSLISPLTNLFVIPLTSLGLIFSLIAVLLSYVNLFFASIYASAADLFIRLSMEINRLSLKLPLSYLQGDYTIVLSVSISLVIIYMVFTKSKINLLFRGIASAMLVLFALILYDSFSDQDSVVIYPRTNCTLVFSKSSSQGAFAYIADRRPEYYITKDASLLKYISETEGKLIIGYDSFFGKSLANQVREKRQTDIVYISPENSAKIRQILKLNEKFPQITTLMKL